MTRYVKEISFVICDSPIQGVPNMIDVDMNAGSGGKYIYPQLIYTDNPNEAITGFGFIQDNQAVPHNFHKINQDLNQGAGGRFNYLCYTKVGNAKVTAITFIAVNCGLNEDRHGNYKVFRQDLNTGAEKRGKYVYLLYKTNQ